MLNKIDEIGKEVVMCKSKNHDTICANFRISEKTFYKEHLQPEVLEQLQLASGTT